MNYKKTRFACFYTYLATASIFSLPPILFVTFREMYGVSYTLLGTLVLTNFCTQLIVDLLFSFFGKHFNPHTALKIMPVLIRVLPWQLWAYVGVVVVIRLAAYTVGAIRYRQFVSLHTILNKLTGLGVFGIPYMIKQSFGVGYCWVACTVAFTASTWELILHCTRSKLPS